MLKFAIASFLFLQVVFSAEIHGGTETSFNVEGNVRPSISNRFNNIRDIISGFLSDKNVSAKFEAAIKRDPAFKEKLEAVTETMIAAAQAIKTNNAEKLAELSESLKGALQTVTQSGGSLRPFFNAQGANSLKTFFDAQAAGNIKPSFGAQAASSLKPSFGSQGVSRPTANAPGASKVEDSMQVSAASFNREM